MAEVSRALTFALVTVPGPAATAVARPLAPHPDLAALVLLILVLVAMLVIGFIWFREDDASIGHVQAPGGSRELRQLLALGESAWWHDFERQFASYVASHPGRSPDDQR